MGQNSNMQGGSAGAVICFMATPCGVCYNKSLSGLGDSGAGLWVLTLQIIPFHQELNADPLWLVIHKVESKSGERLAVSFLSPP